MTHDEIDKMEAGREMDALVAEKVMGHPKQCNGLQREPYTSFGCQVCRENAAMDYYGWHEHPLEPIPYSTSITAAWEVLAHFKSFCLSRIMNDYMMVFNRSLLKDDILSRAIAPTAPLAICRAALKATLK